jgi:hypothetical protein
MSNELAVAGNMPLESMTLEQLQLVQNQIIARQVGLLQSRLEAMQEELNKAKAELEIAKEEQALHAEQMQHELEKTKAMAAANQRVREPKYGWVNQGDFGRFLNPSVGAKTMGKLLKIVGLAMRTKGATTPYRKYIGKYADVIAHERFTQVRWHYENCMTYIDEWLKEKGLFEQFYSFETSRQVEDFIDRLYKEAI